MPKEPNYEAICLRAAHLLQKERLARKLSLTRTAELAGISRQMVGYLESGERAPSLETLLRLCWALELNPADVITKATKEK